MRHTFFFFNVTVPNLDRELDPLYSPSVSDLETYLQGQGVEIHDMWKETLEKNQIYSGYWRGFKYRYGFTLDSDTLIFFFTLPASLKRLHQYPVRVREKIEERLIKGFVTREFRRLGVVQFAELIDSHLYVATEW